MIRVCSVKLDLFFMSMRMLVDLSLYVRILKLKVDNLQAKYMITDTVAFYLQQHL